MQSDSKKEVVVPIKERKRMRDNKIRALYKLGYSMNQICVEVGCSKTTVFFAINGRPKKLSQIKNK